VDLRRLREGDWIMGGSGLLLLVSLFLPWYEIGTGRVVGPPDALDAHASAWDAFTVLDVLLALGALAAIAVVIVTAMHSTPALPLTMESLVALLALVLLILVVFRLADPPDVSFLESTASPATRERVDDLDRGVGAWLGLVGTLGIFAGGLLAMRDERRSPAGRHTDLTGVPVDSPPEIETLPAPRPEAGS
jgi:Tryptophan-associated transmembrane protein (Trp_oprn_chp)